MSLKDTRQWEILQWVGSRGTVGHPVHVESEVVLCGIYSDSWPCCLVRGLERGKIRRSEAKEVKMDPAEWA